MSLDAGEILHNRYRIESTLAKGGMGAIYRAVDESLGVPVAVKENLFSSPESSRQFRREATILANLRHPNLPRVTDHFILPEVGQYLVMDFISGEDLRDRLKRTRTIPQDEALFIAVSVLDALDYLHHLTPPILHRDIKPGNIKITPNGQVYLVDFGLAKVVQGDGSTTTGAQSLTPGYAPPEQYGQGTDARSDLYSLGATLYVALTGCVPEDGISRAMKTNKLTPIRQLNPDVPEWFANIIEKAMAVDPASRYQTAIEFRDALMEQSGIVFQSTTQQTGSYTGRPTMERKAAAQTAPPSFNPPSDKTGSTAVEPPKKPFPWLAVILPAVAVLAVLVVVFAFVLPGMQKPTSPTAVVPPAETQADGSTQVTEPPQPSDTTPTNAQENAVTKEPAQLPTDTPTMEPPAQVEQIAFVSTRDGLPQIYRMNADGSNVVKVTNMADGACQPDWSPDGARLVFISPCAGNQDEYPNSAMYLINADGTGLQPLHTLPGGDFDPAWSPQGDVIYFTSLREGTILHIYSYNLADNSVMRITTNASYDRRARWSPDGTKIAFESKRLDGRLQIYLMNPDGSEVSEFSRQPGGEAIMPAWAPDMQVLTYTTYTNTAAPHLVARQNAGVASEVELENLTPAYNADYSNDGMQIVFDSTGDIFAIRSSGGSAVNLTNDPADDFQPVYRPASQ